MKKLGIIGFGNMANAIVQGLVAAGAIDGSCIFAYNRSPEKLDAAVKAYGLTACKNELEVVEQADVVLLAVKPNVVLDVITKVAVGLSGKAVISVIAGYSFARFAEILPPSTRHLSLMPNTPLAVGSGVTLFEETHSLTDEEFLYVDTLFRSIGAVEILPSHLMSVAGSVSGCGPAFLYMVIEAIADGAVMEGLPRDVAYRLASQTLIGAGAMQRETGIHPAALKDQVCSPGGLTIRGVKALEDAGIRAAFMEAIKASK